MKDAKWWMVTILGCVVVAGAACDDEEAECNSDRCLSDCYYDGGHPGGGRCEDNVCVCSDDRCDRWSETRQIRCDSQCESLGWADGSGTCVDDMCECVGANCDEESSRALDCIGNYCRNEGSGFYECESCWNNGTWMNWTSCECQAGVTLRDAFRADCFLVGPIEFQASFSSCDSFVNYARGGCP